MRFGRLAAAVLFLSSLSTAAFANGGTPPAKSDPARVPIRNAINNANSVDGRPGTASNPGVKTVNPTYGPNGPGPGSGWERTHQPRNLGTWNSDPIIAQRDNGKFYDARTGSNRERGTIGVQRAQDAVDRQQYYDQKNSITLYDGQTGTAQAAILKGEAGSFDDKTGTGAEIKGCVGCAEAEAGGSVGVINGGVQASGNFRAGVYVARVEGQAGKQWDSGVVNGGVHAQGSAMVGAEVKGTGTVEISKERITANGKVGAFAGGRAEGQVSGNVGLNNVGSVKGTVMGEVSYGIGASAEGYFTVDWSTWTVKTGGRASATLGVGAGVGFQTEISVKPAVDWVVNNAGAAYDAVSSGVSSAASTIGNGAVSVAKKLCFWCSDPPAPPAAPMPAPAQVQTANQTPLHAPTGPAAQMPPGDGNANTGGPADGAGKVNALGRD